MNDGQSAAIWLTAIQDRSSVDIVEFVQPLVRDAIVDICDVSGEPENSAGRCTDLRELLHDAEAAFLLAGRQLDVYPVSSHSSVHTGLEFFKRGFADHMLTDLYKQGMMQLPRLARKQRTPVIS